MLIKERILVTLNERVRTNSSSPLRGGGLRWGGLISALLILLLSAPAQAQKQVPTSQAEIKLSFAPLVKKSAPAVVNIFTRKTVRQRSFSPLFDDPFFRRFFGEQFSGRAGPRKKVQNSLGSGVIVNANGTIITNHHVIKGAEEITVVLSDRREFDAKLVGSDKRTDLAVLKISAGAEKLPFLPFRDSDDLEVGDLVLAIGNPFGVGQTVTSGIVSALARTQVGINDLNFFIQTDAAINPGNSGGALITLDGKLVGINSAIYSKGGGSVGIGFAIPTNMVRTVLAGLTGGGRVVRPWIGAEGQGVTSDIASSIGMKRPAGILINGVYKKGPADRAGIKVGDVIIGVGKHEVNDTESLRFRIATRPIGESLDIKLIRRGKIRQVIFPVEAPPEKPKTNKAELSGYNPLQGVTVGNLSPALSDQIGMNLLSRGVVILETRPRSAAKRFGFQPRDIIKEINGAEVKTVGQLKRLLSRKSAQWNISISRGGKVLSMSVNQ
ncbi:MAG: Do family serine endopeptidase [Rhodospirillaceae bacterium]|jgi:Do/DeqQ family serine protease|nr:Do family serine endopeptidase [Rhodospirillaceae bacterium]MBT4587653.1 Do family serine endopeptidase [Rhodospirillaceae bacterium]MBT4940354.1 Do family serine endopeptidase [Rhodospirillaceae bacterium]MBT5939871.1 Do family serine endopeptidase [Rhodospirillaceae bacterium]MBT7265470.1 Do family serine endopeptidase [Rhodospirillaceae bacterium]